MYMYVCGRVCFRVDLALTWEPLCMHAYMNAFNPLCLCVSVCKMQGVRAIPGCPPLACSPVVRHEAQSKQDGS